MSEKMSPSSAPGMDRREFLATGLRTAAALPAVALLAACGSGEQSEPATPAPTPQPAPTPPQAETPKPAPAPTPPPATSGSGADRLVTEIPSNETLVSSLQYVHESAKPDQKCSSCQLFTATSGGLGKCQLFAEGVVKETGWCASWVAKVT